MAIRTVLFDLDGTLLDTAPDLTYALNQVLREESRSALSLAALRPLVSHGAKALIRYAFSLEPGDPGFEARRERLLEVYRANLARETRPFPGILEVLDILEARGLNWGVVTNKPSWLTEPLLAALALLDRAACVISGDTAEHAKPHPAPMLLACRQAGSQAFECLYIGDAQRDIEAGRNAGMRTLIAGFGYVPPDIDINVWNADGIIERPQEILEWLNFCTQPEAGIRP
jgi:2-phosphoglycolate phosphatase